MKKEIVIIAVAGIVLFGTILTVGYLLLRTEENPDSDKSEDSASEEDEEVESFSETDHEAVKLIFIHHSTGQNWLADDNGGLGEALAEAKFFVSDTNYDWGPNAIGSTTDIGHWWLWFRGPDSDDILDALYSESSQFSEYTRLEDDPGGENEIILFKSCFPNSNLGGSH